MSVFCLSRASAHMWAVEQLKIKGDSQSQGVLLRLVLQSQLATIMGRVPAGPQKQRRCDGVLA